MKCKGENCNKELNTMNESDLVHGYCMECAIINSIDREIPLSTLFLQQQRKIKNLKDQLREKLKDVNYLAQKIDNEEDSLATLEKQRGLLYGKYMGYKNNQQ